MMRSTMGRVLFSFVILAVLPGLASTALAESTWSFVTIPDLPEGANLERLWTDQPGNLYVWANRSTPSSEAFLYHWDGTSWTQVLHLPAHHAHVWTGHVFGTGPSDVFASAYSESDSNPKIYHYDGIDWTQQTLPDGVIGKGCHHVMAIAGEPGNVYASFSCQTYPWQRKIRYDGNQWQMAYSEPNASKQVGYISQDEIYSLGCWGHLLYDGGAWTWYQGFDFCDVWDVWGMRDDGGALHLYAAGANNFNNGIRVWRFTEDYPGSMTGSWGSKYGTAFSDPPGYGYRNAGVARGIWGSGPDDIYVVGGRDGGAVYRFDGASWERITVFGDIPHAPDVWGSGPGDVWVSLSDGRLLHYGTQCEDPAPLGQGYWHRQCLGLAAANPLCPGIDPGRHGRGPEEPAESGFCPDMTGCAESRLEDLGFYGMLTCEGMDADPPSDPCERAYKQLTALILNVCSDRLEDGCDVDVTAAGCSSTSVGELIAEVAGLIDGGLCDQAADCADAVNEGEALAEGGGKESASPGADDAPSLDRPRDRRRGGRRIRR